MNHRVISHYLDYGLALPIENCMSLFKMRTDLHYGFVNFLDRFSVHVDLRECKVSIVRLHVLQGPLNVTTELTIFPKVCQIVDLQLMKDFFDLEHLPSVNNVNGFMHFCKESVYFGADLGLILIDLALLYV